MGVITPLVKRAYPSALAYPENLALMAIFIISMDCKTMGKKRPGMLFVLSLYYTVKTTITIDITCGNS
jgi:hypothetical protein